MKRRNFILTTGSTALLAACGGGGSDSTSSSPTVEPPAVESNVVLAWNEVMLAAVRAVRPGPPMVARTLAIVHTAMYDAWSAYDNVALPTFGPSQRRPAEEHTESNKVRAISYAAIWALIDQYPTQTAAFEAEMAALGFPLTRRLDGVTPESIGNNAAQRVIDFRKTDGSNQDGLLSAVGGVAGTPFSDYASEEYPLYVPSNQPALLTASTLDIDAPGLWQPLSWVNAAGATVTPSYIGPFWGRVKPFALTSASQFRPAAPVLDVESPEFRAQAQEVIDIHVRLTDEQKVIAEYWADGPASELPPGHWNLFAQVVARRDNQTIDESVKMFYALTNALFDASIAVWEAKRYYNYARPVSAIRDLFKDQIITGYGLGGVTAGLGTIAGESWHPYQPSTFPTPPFPEHVSGHSSFSSAGAEVLRLFTDSDAFNHSYTQLPRSLRVEPTVPVEPVTLSWATFTEAANEAGMSRLYGGIHFTNGNTGGLTLGRLVGANAYNKAQNLWSGSIAV